MEIQAELNPGELAFMIEKDSVNKDSLLRKMQRNPLYLLEAKKKNWRSSFSFDLGEGVHQDAAGDSDV